MEDTIKINLEEIGCEDVDWSSDTVLGSVVGCCEYSNEPSVFINCGLS